MRANSEAHQHVDHRAKDFDYLGRVVPASMQTQGKEASLRTCQSVGVDHVRPWKPTSEIDGSEIAAM